MQTIDPEIRDILTEDEREKRMAKPRHYPAQKLPMRMEVTDVGEYSIHRPMTWNEYKTMPDDVRRKYLLWLQTEKSASTADMGKMFGRSQYMATTEVRRLGLNRDRLCPRATREQKRAWAEFIGQMQRDDAPTSVPETAADTKPVTAPPTTPPNVQKAEICLSGHIDKDMIINRILPLLPMGVMGEIRVSVICHD